MILPFILFVVTIANFVPDVPLFAWSGESYLLGKNRQITQTLTTKEIPLLVGSMLSSTKDFQQYVSPDGKLPELIVLFLEPKLRSDEVIRYSSALPFLRNMVEGSTSSIYSPFVQMDDNLLFPLVQVASAAQKNGASVFYHGKGALGDFLQEKIPSLINTDISSLAPTVFSNGVVDLLFVELHSELPTLPQRLAETDSTIERINKMITSVSSQYISIYTGLRHHQVEDEIHPYVPESHHHKRNSYIFFDQNNSIPDDNVTLPHWFNRWFPGWFWELFIVCLIILIICFFGTMTLFSLQGLDKLAKPKDLQRR